MHACRRRRGAHHQRQSVRASVDDVAQTVGALQPVLSAPRVTMRAMTLDDAAPEVPPTTESAMAPGYNVWFGLQHVTLLGFRHPGRREQCRKCNPRATEPAEPGRPRPAATGSVADG